MKRHEDSLSVLEAVAEKQWTLVRILETLGHEPALALARAVAAGLASLAEKHHETK